MCELIAGSWSEATIPYTKQTVTTTVVLACGCHHHYLGDEVVVQEDVSWPGEKCVWRCVLDLCPQEGVGGEAGDTGVAQLWREIDECHRHLDIGVGVVVIVRDCHMTVR